jgi:hypothetical protein
LRVVHNLMAAFTPCLCLFFASKSVHSTRLFERIDIALQKGIAQGMLVTFATRKLTHRKMLSMMRCRRCISTGRGAGTWKVLELQNEIGATGSGISGGVRTSGAGCKAQKADARDNVE